MMIVFHETLTCHHADWQMKVMWDPYTGQFIDTGECSCRLRDVSMYPIRSPF